LTVLHEYVDPFVGGDTSPPFDGPDSPGTGYDPGSGSVSYWKYGLWIAASLVLLTLTYQAYKLGGGNPIGTPPDFESVQAQESWLRAVIPHSGSVDQSLALSSTRDSYQSLGDTAIRTSSDVVTSAVNTPRSPTFMYGYRESLDHTWPGRTNN
jgi:hypothetical protein